MLGFDVGVIEHEFNHHSTVLHEVIGGAVPELGRLAFSLNCHGLFPTIDDARICQELREFLIRNPEKASRLETHDVEEKVVIVAVYDASGKVRGESLGN